MKVEEKWFFQECLRCWKNADLSPMYVIDKASYSIPYKRMIYYLKKWSDKDIYDYGVRIDLGWFVESKITKHEDYFDLYIEVVNENNIN